MPKKPNILFFFTDQERADACGCYGQELPITPNLDALAEEGTRFEWAFTPQPVDVYKRQPPDQEYAHDQPASADLLLPCADHSGTTSE